MTATTVRTILAMILENNLQMDDVIEFSLSSETEEIDHIDLPAAADIDFASITTHKIAGDDTKYLTMIFDLNILS